jgi:two-component system, chemotaxis family, sensor kinase CheA
MRRLFRYLVLPAEITEVERVHLARLNRLALFFFLLHGPVLILIAALNHTEPLLAAELFGLVMCGPLIAFFTFDNPRRISLVFGITSMFMGGLLVHVGQGPMQIEMHFYFFVSLALLAVFANPLIIIAASITVALHHLVLYLLLPGSAFNYEASLLTVGVHALFVVLEAIAACFVARSFFDSVVGLEKIVDRRTRELRERNDDLKLVLDNVGQGFISAGQDGILVAEHSLAIETWLGQFAPSQRVWDYFAAADSDFGRALEAGWANLADDILPQDVILESLPSRLTHQGRELLCEYKPIASSSNVLIVVSDVTAQLERTKLEDEQRETLKMFQSISTDRVGCVEFLGEANALVQVLLSDTASNTDISRALHTLKGNASLFGVSSVERACQEAEGNLNRDGGMLLESQRVRVAAVWERAAVRMAQFLGGESSNCISVAEVDYDAALSAVRGSADRHAIVRLLESWQDEDATQRLGRIADQAKALANRLGKGPIEVRVHAGRLKLPHAAWSNFWAAFAHVVRNAVDHGLEKTEVRLAEGKSPHGCIRLSIERIADQVQLTVADDGRGIAWGDLERVAAAAGLPVATPQQLTEAMFVDGITTKMTASEISGQGVGMGAIRAACRQMGGTLRVMSEVGQGTQLTFVFPLATLSVPPSVSAVSQLLLH